MNNVAKENGLLLKSDSDSQQIVSVPIHLTGIYTYKEAAALSKCSYVTIWRESPTENSKRRPSEIILG